MRSAPMWGIGASPVFGYSTCPKGLGHPPNDVSLNPSNGGFLPVTLVHSRTLSGSADACSLVAETSVGLVTSCLPPLLPLPLPRRFPLASTR